MIYGAASAFETPSKADSIIAEINRAGLTNAAKAYELIEELNRIAENGKSNSSLQVQVLYEKVFVNYLQGKTDSTLTIDIHAFLRKGGKNSDIAQLQLSLSMNYTTEGRYADAFQYGLMALETFEQLGDQTSLAKTAFVLGNICTYIKSYKMAESYYIQALENVTPEQFEYYQTKLNLSKLSFYTEPVNEAIDSMLAVIPAVENYCDTGLIAVAYLNLATCYTIQGSFDKAFYYHERMLDLFKSIDNNKLLFTFYQGLGLYYFYTSNISKSFEYFYLSKQIALVDRNLEQLSYALYNLGFLHDETGHTDSALFYLKEYTDVNNQLLNNSGAIEAYQAYVTVFLEASKDKLTIAEQKIQLKNRRFTFFAVSSAAIAILVLLLFVIFQQKKQQQALLKEAERKDLEIKLEHEQKLKQLQTKRHKEGLDAKAREITSYSLLLSNKNQILQQIASITKRLPAEHPEVAEINSIIKNNINTDQAWGDFMLHFQKIHPKFFQRLKALPNASHITENELRLCAYFCIGMSAKQIAQILNVSPESVRIHRYRLKKKLGLTEEQDLDDFIRNI